jgi:hypothetical protein
MDMKIQFWKRYIIHLLGDRCGRGKSLATIFHNFETLFWARNANKPELKQTVPSVKSQSFNIYLT